MIRHISAHAHKNNKSIMIMTKRGTAPEVAPSRRLTRATRKRSTYTTAATTKIAEETDPEDSHSISTDTGKLLKRKRSVTVAKVKAAESPPPSADNAEIGKKRNRAHTVAVKEEEDAKNNPLSSKSRGTPEQLAVEVAEGAVSSESELSSLEDVDWEEKIEVATEASIKANHSNKANKQKKTNPYNLTPGTTPYPGYPHPTPEECYTVNDLLSSFHGEQSAPSTPPIPSLNVSGCGEVPSILDALIRTRLSAATTNKNSSAAFSGLVRKFGILQSGTGKGSVDWDKVRRADVRDIFTAIECGGLAKVKSQDIKTILEMVYAENNEAAAAARTTTGDNNNNNKPLPPTTTTNNSPNPILSLDHLHSLKSSQEIMSHLTRYPGIGPKTASCVLLFCMHRPSFAVDTHVFRLLQYLRWLPPSSPGGGIVRLTEINAFRHVEVRVPDELKYSLHKLFVMHGRMCPRCRVPPRVAPEGYRCPIEALVVRRRKKGGKVGGGTGWKGMEKVKKKNEKEEEEEEEDMEISEEEELLSGVDEDSTL